MANRPDGDGQACQTVGQKNARLRLSTELLAPRDQRADAGQQQQEQPDGNVHAIEERPVDADLFAVDGFGDHREQRAPQDREAARQQDQVVKQETRFARENAFQLRFALQIIQAIQDQVDVAAMPTARNVTK